MVIAWIGQRKERQFPLKTAVCKKKKKNKNKSSLLRCTWPFDWNNWGSSQLVVCVWCINSPFFPISLSPWKEWPETRQIRTVWRYFLPPQTMPLVFRWLHGSDDFNTSAARASTHNTRIHSITMFSHCTRRSSLSITSFNLWDVVVGSVLLSYQFAGPAAPDSVQFT